MVKDFARRKLKCITTLIIPNKAFLRLVSVDVVNFYFVVRQKMLKKIVSGCNLVAIKTTKRTIKSLLKWFLPILFGSSTESF